MNKLTRIKLTCLNTIILVYITTIGVSYAKSDEVFPIAAAELAIDPLSALPTDFKIDVPVARKLKLSTAFSPTERELDTYWFQKKSELARMFVIDNRLAFASKLAAELDQLTDDEFAFLSIQTYFWTDLIGQVPRAFTALSPSKMRILGDTIINRDLIRLDRSLPSYIVKLIGYLDIDDPLIFEKLESFLPAALEDKRIEDEARKKAFAYRQKKHFIKDDEGVKLADTFIQKLEFARKARLDRIMALPRTPIPIEDPKAPEPERKKRPWERDVFVKVPEPVTKKPKIESDEKWRETKMDFANWLFGDDFDVKQFDIDSVRDHLRFLLKQFSVENPETQEVMRNAFTRTMAQADDFNKLFDIVHDTADERDLSVFMALLQGKAGEGKARDPNLIDLLWRSEKGLIIAGGSVRDLQVKRLAAMYKNLDETQLTISLNNDAFWILLEDQPIATAAGVKTETMQKIAEHFLNNIRKDKNRPTSFINKVVPLLDPDVDPDRVYGSLLALAPLAKFIPAAESKISFKVNALARALKDKYDAKQVNEMVRILRSTITRR